MIRQGLFKKNSKGFSKVHSVLKFKYGVNNKHGVNTVEFSVLESFIKLIF